MLAKRRTGSRTGDYRDVSAASSGSHVERAALRLDQRPPAIATATGCETGVRGAPADGLRHRGWKDHRVFDSVSPRRRAPLPEGVRSLLREIQAYVHAALDGAARRVADVLGSRGRRARALRAGARGGSACA